MTRKDYELLAESLRKAWKNVDEENAWDDAGFMFGAVMGNLVGALMNDNERFDAAKFIRAANPDKANADAMIDVASEFKNG